MPQEFSRFVPYLVAALIVYAVYRRLRRSFGRQPLSPGRMIFRISVLSVLGVLFLVTSGLRSGAFAAAAFAGLLTGVLLAVWGASQTRFETVDGERYYVPHTYTGIAVSLLFIGRVVYRLFQTYQTAHGGSEPMPGPSGPAGYVSSPLTLGLFFVLVGYYVYYLSFILKKAKQLKAEDAQQEAPPVGTGDGRAYTGRADSGTPS